MAVSDSIGFFKAKVEEEPLYALFVLSHLVSQLMAAAQQSTLVFFFSDWNGNRIDQAFGGIVGNFKAIALVGFGAGADDTGILAGRGHRNLNLLRQKNSGW